MASRPRIRSLAAVALALLAFPALAPAEEVWRSRGGSTSIRFNHATLDDLGLELAAVDESARPARPGYLGFAVEPGTGVEFVAPQGHFRTLSTGALRHVGGPTLVYAGRTIELRGFELRAVGGAAALELVDRSGRRWFSADHAQPHLVPRERQLYLVNVDLLVSAELAALLGRPELVGLYAGTLDLELPIEAPDGFETLGDGGCPMDTEPPKDLLLTVVSSLSQVAREPNVRVALSLFAELTNLGPGTIPWYRSIEPDGPPENVGQHPYLGMQMYRRQGGVLRQIGRSDLKHAFFATNTDCPCPSGQLLYPGCDDFYGVSTNEDRKYLAPREEMAASSGTWASLGSHFDALPVDDFRDHEGESDHDDFEHRLVVAESELASPGDFFIEAWYLVQGDPDIFNSMGHRAVTPSLGGNVWSFSFTSPLVTTSILDAWIDPLVPDATSLAAGFRTPGGEGHVQLAVRTSAAAGSGEPGGGATHYEYALMNHDLDSGVRELFVPLPAGAVPSGVGFEDIDEDPANDWTPILEVGGLRWRAPSGAEQPWGSLYNFRFDVAGAPGVVVAGLGTAGTAGTIVLPTLAPGGLASGPVLHIEGDCATQPRLRGGGLTPNGRVALYGADEAGTSAIPAGERCPGTLLSLGDAQFLGGRVADADGRVSFAGGPLAGSCGQRFQIVDHATCAVSNVQLAQ
jgi:hypothetical protein